MGTTEHHLLVESPAGWRSFFLLSLNDPKSTRVHSDVKDITMSSRRTGGRDITIVRFTASQDAAQGQASIVLDTKLGEDGTLELTVAKGKPADLPEEWFPPDTLKQKRLW